MKTFIEVDEKNKTVKLTGNVEKEAMETAVEKCNEVGGIYTWSCSKSPKPQIVIRCDKEFTAERIMKMVDWLSMFVAGSILKKASAEFADAVMNNRELKIETENPYKEDAFLVMIGSDISEEIMEKIVVEDKTRICLDEYFSLPNEYYSMALSCCKEDAEKTRQQHLDNDFRILTVKYSDQRLAVRIVSGYITPKGHPTVWMTEEEFLELIENLSNIAKVDQIQFLNVTPPQDVAREIFDIFNGVISIVSIPVFGFLTKPKGSEEFFGDNPYNTGIDLEPEEKTQKFLS